MPPLGACAFERVSALLAIPDAASAKSVSPIATVRELEYGLSVSAPPVGAAESGVTVKPRLYLAFGISGAPHHLSGVSRGATIVAVNQDANAAIFRVADYGGVFDAVAFARQLELLF